MISAIINSRAMHIILLLLLLAVTVAMSFSNARWREQIRNFSFDNYNIMKSRQPSDKIVIVDIDEASLAQVGQMPWPRTVMADLVRNLTEMGAAVVAFDIVFAEPDRSSPHAMAERFQYLNGFDDVLPRLNDLPDNDTVFGLAIGQANNVVTGFSFTNENTPATARQKGIFRGKNLEQFVPNLRGVSTNLRTIDKYSAGNGSFFVSTDTDGIIRRVPMLVAHKKPDSKIVSTYPSLALEIVRVLDDERGGRVLLEDESYAKLDPARFGIEGIEMGQRFIPTNAKGEFLVYFAKSSPDWYVPAYQILDKSYPADQIQDKVVLIGTSAVGLKDIRSTPLDTFLPGVEVHLNIVDQILQGKFLNRSIEAEGIEAVAILATGLFIILFAPFIGALAQAAIVMCVIGGLIYGGWFAFDQYGMLIDVTYPSFALLALFMLSTILTYLRSEEEKQQVRQAFGLYISPDFMKELTESPDKLKLGGEIKELSVMFSDIRNFTSISEGLKPEELIQLMNGFLTPMSDLVMKNRGTIDKYMGDAMMAFWNAPLDVDEHAKLACKTALSMQTALDALNEGLEQKAKESGRQPVLLKAGIGINTGDCAVGNMGSRQRFAYSALGDAVNLASRLEGQTKQYGVGILVGEETYRQASDMALLELDLLRVKGKAVPVRVYALLGCEDMAALPEFQQWREKHDEMLHAYRKKKFDVALRALEVCEKESVSDDLREAYAMYKQRITNLTDNPPPTDWDGVFEAASK